MPRFPDSVSVKVPKVLAEKLSRRAKEHGFPDLDSYLAFFIQQVLSELESQPAGEPVRLEGEDEAAVERKLKDLGYA